MRKLLIFMIIPLLCITAFAVNKIDFTLNPQATAKELTEAPLSGTWVINRYVIVDNSSASEEEGKKLLGKAMDVSLKRVIFDDIEYKNVKFKVKSVDAKSFLWDTYKIKPQSIGISKNEFDVVTIFSSNRYYDDLISLDGDNIMKSYNGFLLFLNREGSDAVNKFPLNKDMSKITTMKEREIKSKSGLLLGLKCKEGTGGRYFYRTVWVSYENGKINPVLQMKNILVPRTNGFCKVGLEENVKNSEDILWTQTVNAKQKNDGWQSIKDKKFIRNIIDGEILFIGDSYISIDINDGKQRKLKVLPLDNISGEGMDIKKLLGKNAETAFLSSGKYNRDKVTDEDNIELESTNWGVTRRSGRWALRGRLNFKDSSETQVIDFDIPHPTSKALVNYDEVYPFLDDLKEEYPYALDVLCSPNRDLVVIVTENKLLLVNLLNNKLSDVKATFDLKENEKVIMAHWATGSYVDQWAKKVK